MATLNRRPAPEEVKKFAAYLDEKNPAGEAVWTLISCSEIRFNH